ncbi:MAG: MFS transporter [Streptosporangiales bacterium]|nr:MFS transporter [Streptosporangiales bacterium]
MIGTVSTQTPTSRAKRDRPRIVHRPSLVILIVSHAVVDFHQGAVPAMLPFLVATRHYDYAAVAGITLAATLLASLVQPLFGAITDRRKMPWLVGVGPLVAGLGIGISGVFDVYAVTWAAVALAGIAVAAYHPEAASAARRASGGSAQGMSWFSVGGLVGLAGAPLLVEPVLSQGGVSATPVLAAFGACAFVVLLPLWAWSRRRFAAGNNAARGGRTQPAGRDDWRSFGWLTAAVVTRSVLQFGITAFVALYLIHDLDASTRVGAASLTAFLGAGAVGTVFGGALGDRLGRVRAMRIGYLACLPGLLGLLLAPNVPVALAAAAVLGFATMMPFAVQVTLGQEYLPNRVGTASGLTLGVAMTIGGSATPLLGMLADARGLPTALAVLLVVPVVSLLFTLRLRDAAIG